MRMEAVVVRMIMILVVVMRVRALVAMRVVVFVPGVRLV